MRFKATIEDPWLSRKYEFVIQSNSARSVAIQAAERALKAETDGRRVKEEYAQALGQKRKDMVLANIRNQTVVILVT